PDDVGRLAGRVRAARVRSCGPNGAYSRRVAKPVGRIASGRLFDRGPGGELRRSSARFALLRPSSNDCLILGAGSGWPGVGRERPRLNGGRAAGWTETVWSDGR